MKNIILSTIVLLLLGANAASAQSTTTRFGTFDAGGVTEYSQYLYIGAGAHITIAAGQQWVIASQYVQIAPTAIIDGGGQMIFDDPGNFGSLSETVSWAGQPTTVDGGNSQLLVNVVNRNPNNIVLATVTVTADAAADGITANTDHTLYIGTSFAWATAHGDATALAYNDVLLGSNDFRFAAAATETGYSPSAYAVTNGTGHVVKDSYTGNWIFPVGIAESTASGSDYTPASISNTTANGFHVSVQNYAASASDETAGISPFGINRTWNIYADNAAGSGTVTLEHNDATNEAGFDDANHYVTRWSNTNPNTDGDLGNSNSAWEANTAGAGSTGNLSSTGTVSGSSMMSHDYTSFATTAGDDMAFYTKATLSVPDLSPTISFVPATIVGTTNIGVILNVYEFNNVATGGLISVYILKDPKYVLAFSPSATTVSGNAVNNSAWSFDGTSNPSYYVLTTSSVIAASGQLSAGFTTTFNPNSAKGTTIISALIADGSGGEVDDSDNSDDDELVYKP